MQTVPGASDMTGTLDQCPAAGTASRLFVTPTPATVRELGRALDCTYVLRSLWAREFIETRGPGPTVDNPLLYAVTEVLPQHCGLTSVNEPPDLEAEDGSKPAAALHDARILDAG